ncbi:MAG: DUF294 nucleotidyltransferase-like domain-containing protein, partial [Candidatus Nucleicultricaceae bacterium]
SKQITKDFMSWIGRMTEEITQELGPVPTNFSILSMGSMARQEANLYSDLEISFLVGTKSPETVHYFSKVFQRLSDRIHVLGEHHTGYMGFHLDGADHAPFRNKFFARYADPEWAQEMLNYVTKTKQSFRAPTEGSKLFLATPEEFAAHIDPNHIASNTKINPVLAQARHDKIIEEEFKKAVQNPMNSGKTHLEILKQVQHNVLLANDQYSPKEEDISRMIGSSLSRSIGHFYGDKNLYDRYKKAAKELYDLNPTTTNHSQINTRGQEISFNWLKKTFEDFSKKVSFFKTGKLGSTVDLKRDIYRFPEQLLTNLSLYYGLETENSFDTIQKLKEINVFDTVTAKEFRDLVNFTIGLRIDNQIKVKRSPYKVFLDEALYKKTTDNLGRSIDSLKKQRAGLVRKKASTEAIDQIDYQIIRKNEMLDTVKSSAPGKVLSQSTINLLEKKYIPIMQKLLSNLEAWVDGNQIAFNSTATPS